MMFLQYFMFGAWFVTLGTYMSRGLHFDRIIGTAYGTQGIAAIASTLLVGTIADRFVAAQKVLGNLALFSGMTLLLLSCIQHSQQLFLCIILLHFLCFVPSVALSNAITLGAVTDRARQYPTVRVAGTAGWIVAGLVVGIIPDAAQTRLPLVAIYMGIGVIFGSNVANWIYDANSISTTQHDWRTIWLIPAVIALCTGIMLSISFKDAPVVGEARHTR
jgi:MFS family permease